MSSIGPHLPPELQKRKRNDDEDDDDDDDDDGASSDSSTGPIPPCKSDRVPSPPSTKRTRVIGPAPPPAPLDQRPPSSDEEQDDQSESDDGFGPSLPSTTSDKAIPVKASIGPQIPMPVPSAAPAKRDEWMTLAPASGDWSSRVDPTKLKNRKFNTGKGPKSQTQSTGGGGDSSWYETPEQKQARLKREVLGIKDPAPQGMSAKSRARDDADDDTTAKRLKEYNDAQRGPSLYSSHVASQDQSLDDDPSARAFDREKDIGSGSAITATQRRDMVKKATDFSSRFDKARYL